MSLQYVDAKQLKQMIISGANLLEQNKNYVDELNVFPVPDGDTGTNMSLTVMSAAKEVQKVESEVVEDVAKALSSGALRGARGNSGVILSQLFRGFYKGLSEVEQIDTVAMANAFQKGVETAYKAVMKPKEGTILTVARESAEKAMQLAMDSNDIEYVLEETINYGKKVLDKTPDMLPVLKQAGVVDAGGQGLIYILEGALNVLKGKGVTEIQENKVQSAPKKLQAAQVINTEDIKFGYCTEFIILTDNTEEENTVLRPYLESLGDSIVVVEDEELIKVHVHTDDPGKALQKALEFGQLTNIKIDNMREQHQHNLEIAEDDMMRSAEPEERKDFGFIAVSIGEGLNEIFKGLGVDHIIEGGQTMNPSTEDILNAVDKVNADCVYVLPNNKNIILAAEQAQKLSEDKKVIVVPTTTIPQGITALINFDPDATSEENHEEMTEGLKDVKTGQITYAVRDTSIEDHEIKKDDILGINESKIAVVEKSVDTTVKKLLEDMVDEDSELVSIYFGEDIREEETQELVEFIEELNEDCDVEIHYGGQPLYYYIISVE